MTIAEDTTNSPALATGTGATVQTAAFTPPANCILVAFMWGDANNGSNDETLTASDTLSGTWSTPVLDNARGGAAAAISWSAIGGSPASMQVAVADNKGSVARGIFVRIFTGTHLTAPFGATATAGTAAISLTTTVTNSWCWSAHLGSNATQTAGTNTVQKAQSGGFDSGDAIGAYASTNTTATSGTNITITEVGGTPVHHVMVEIVPPGGATTVNATVDLRASATLTTAGVVTELGTATLAAGATLTAAAGVTELGTAAFAAGAALTVAGTRVQPAAAAFGAGATLSAAGVVTGNAGATMASGAQLLASAGSVIPATVTLAAGAVLTPTATRTVLPGVGFAAGATLSAQGGRTATVAVAFAAGAAFSATPQGLAPLTPTVLVAGGSSGSTLVADGASGSTLVVSGSISSTLIAGGV